MNQIIPDVSPYLPRWAEIFRIDDLTETEKLFEMHLTSSFDYYQHMTDASANIFLVIIVSGIFYLSPFSSIMLITCFTSSSNGSKLCSAICMAS